jgi:hypothetical protein
MKIMTRVFDLYPAKYENLSALAHAMELSPSYISRVRNGKRHINEKFIIGAKKAFPEKRLDELFYFDSDISSGDAREQYRHIVTRAKEEK